VGAVPAGMDKLEPGLFLAAMVTSVEIQDLSGHDRIVVLKARQRMVSFFQAQVFEGMASISQLLVSWRPIRRSLMMPRRLRSGRHCV
jgi:hypothetical protein